MLCTIYGGQAEWERLRREVGGGRTRVAVDRFALAHA